MPGTRFHTCVCLIALLVPLIFSGCNEDKIEKMLGGQVSRGIESTYRPIDDPALQDWMVNLGHTIVGMSTRQHIPYSFRVLDSDSVNAMAAPWGNVYVLRGLLDFAEDEDEVWVVLGHEVGHVVNRDIIKAVKRSFLWNVGLSVVNSESESLANVLGIGLGLLSFHYSREDERDADDLGILYTYRAGHDPRAGVAFFTRLMEKYEKHRPSKIEALLQTHPLTSSRIAAQKARPECDPNNAEALARIGRGYANRGRYMTGIELMQRALEANPKLASGHLAIADAAARRGYLQLAAQRLADAADVLGYVPSISRQSQVIQALQPQHWPAYSTAERDRMTAALAALETQKKAVAAHQPITEKAQSSLAGRVAPLTGTTTKLMARLSSLAETEARVTEQVQDLLLQSNAVINQATDLVSQLEGISDQVASVSASASAVVTLMDRVATLSPMAGPPGAAGWIERSGRELLGAYRDAASAASLAGAAIEPSGRALASCSDAVVYMERLLALGENQLLQDSLRVASAEASKQGAPAREAIKKSREMAARAAARVAVAQINLAAAGATPEEQRALYDIIAYFARVPAEKVDELARQGAGLGEAAACLLACRACRRPASDLLTVGMTKSGVVDALGEAGTSIAGTQVMLKFVAAAVAQELPTGQHEAPRFTS